LSETITCAILVNPSSAFSLFLFIIYERINVKIIYDRTFKQFYEESTSIY
jgi:predicted Abi (CAAX) family protease